MFDAYLQIDLYYNLLLVYVFIAAMLILFSPKVYTKYIPLNSLKEFLLLLFVIAFIGYREWWVEEVFVDSIRYGYTYELISLEDLYDGKDFIFSLLQLICKSLGLTTNMFFIVCATLYAYPLYVVSKRIDRKYSSLFFLVCISSMSFYGYGVNGIRNGIATSLMLLAVSYSKMSLKQMFFFILSIGFHLSVILPISCYFITPLIKKEKYYILIWVLAIPLSFILFGVLSSLIENISFLQSRAGGYLSGQASADIFSKTGFRFDFLLYSLLPIAIRRVYYQTNCSNVDNLYNKLFYTYILANALWILVNQVPFSNRFAYLSWCIMPFISLYPILNRRSRYRSLVLAIFIICYFMFTYLLNAL